MVLCRSSVLVAAPSLGAFVALCGCHASLGRAVGPGGGDTVAGDPATTGGDGPAGDPGSGPGDPGQPCIGCGPCVTGDAPSAFEQTLIELPPASWYQAPASHMRDVCIPDSVGVRGVSGCPAVITAWGGGAFDPVHRRMLIWGGGHDDYWGNELYGFDLATGTWARLTEPSTIPGGTDVADFLNRDPLPDGQPVSRHTYDGLEYVTHLDRFLGHGGARARDGGGTPRTWLFDLSLSTWSMVADGPGGYCLATAYDAARHRLYVNLSESMSVYDFDADTWSALPGFGYPPLWPRYAVGGDKTGVIDPTRGLFWSVGTGQFLVWDIAAGAMVTDAWATTGGGAYTTAARVSEYPDQLFESGGGDVFNVAAPGFDYDSTTDELVAWPNQGAPYILNLTTRAWRLGSATDAPTSATSGGTYGRWRYVAAYNVFILVNSIDENVYFYKHTPGCGPG